jgi:Xaa-Pro aminopeptidase
MLVTSQKNRRYFTGFDSTFGILLLNKSKNIFITDPRYCEMARGLEGFDVRCGSKTETADILSDALQELNAQCLGFEDDEMTVARYESFKLQFTGKDIKLIPAGGTVRELREIKTAEEIECITEAQRISDAVFVKMLKFIKTDVSEKDIAVEIEHQIKLLGGDGLAFDTIVASGTNSSMPHAHPSSKKIQGGDPVTMDFGARVKGYCADMTRTVFVGKPSPEMKNIYNVVLKTQQFAIKNVKAGVKCREIDAYAREVLKANALEQYFTHGLGHGLGLDIHESPSLSQESETVLRQNMIITVEPGVYMPGIGGVRIEDMLLIKEDGYKNLTSSPKDLIIL